MPRTNKTETAVIETTVAETETETTETETPVVKEPKHAALDADRAAWVAANARPAISTCLCGCGGTTKGRFVPGHDAKLKVALETGVAAGCENSIAAMATFGW